MRYATDRGVEQDLVPEKLPDKFKCKQASETELNGALRGGKIGNRKNGSKQVYILLGTNETRAVVTAMDLVA